ncbi:ABC transporter permease [Roseovarius aestuarii]|uniref:Glycine betaine transport system permease protein OpuAB n=1 Tax=Roseovarius aestuarii TaxID=475083 RepID=A0A1X7BXH0_9RHOB|nr:ABC transporter permease subunit [Roseovarius aestuarii]SMC14313.1 Glycine betaine transport system permease protein OpuAB [Roseovarius aestuarii]
MIADSELPTARGGIALSTGATAALIALLTGAVCIALTPLVPWLVKFPDAWALPAAEWIGISLTWFLDLIKPAMRVFSALMAYPMDSANTLFTGMPWPLMIGFVTALGWYIGGLPMAALGLVGLGFVLATGYWLEGMATLALVAVSVPLALFMGAAIGILANEFPRFKSAIQTVLDVMQTVPTFAYLTPLLFLFGFGPVVGLIASAIYAAPPMARNMILGLERVESDIKEAAVMSGGTRLQQLFLIEIPSAKTQIMVGVNQCLMAALSMVIIAAVIGGFKDIGWEVLLTMRKAYFGPSLMAGMVIVIFAMIIDRYSSKLASDRIRHSLRVAVAIAMIGVIVAVASWQSLPDPSAITLLDPVSDWLDAGLTGFLRENGAGLDGLKNGAMFYGLLPLKIGLDGAVLPFTWGFQWTGGMSTALYATAAAAGLALALRGKATLGIVLVIVVGIIETGLAELPWPFVLVGAGAIGWVSGGRKLATFAVVMLALVLFSGLWERALLSLYMSGAAVFTCAIVGGGIGLLCAVSPLAWRFVLPICDMLQTIPLFVFLIPVLMFFQIGEFSAFLAICLYAIVPMIRYTRHGLINTPEEMIEAAVSSGATEWQTMVEVRAPYAAPTILLGLNQTILYAFAMLVIAALIGTTGLGQSIYGALAQADVGLGIASGAAMAILALVADRLVQGFAEERRQALGL